MCSYFSLRVLQTALRHRCTGMCVVMVALCTVHGIIIQAFCGSCLVGYFTSFCSLEFVDNDFERRDSRFFFLICLLHRQPSSAREFT